MDMVIHVLPGDSLVEKFRKTNIAGQVIICRDALVVGPIDAETPLEFWEQRAHFILAEYGEDEIDYHEKVADEIERLSEVPVEAEVNLWFEYELFCSVNMWFCLSLLSPAGAAVYRIEPVVLNTEDRWKGFGLLDDADLKKCFDARTKFSAEDIDLGVNLWNAYRQNDNDRLLELAQTESACFPYLKEVCDAAAERDKRPLEILAEIHFEGKTEFEVIFAEFSRRAGVYGFGDLQVKRILDQMR